MIASDFNTFLADYYFGFLKTPKPDIKRELITKLSESLHENAPIAEPSLQSLFGACKSEETADEMIARIRESSVFNRQIELF